MSDRWCAVRSGSFVDGIEVCVLEPGHATSHVWRPMPDTPSGTPMTTPDAEAVAALAEAMRVADPDFRTAAALILANLPAGWTLTRRSERDALARIAKRAATMGPCSQTHHEHIARDARAAIEGGQ